MHKPLVLEKYSFGIGDRFAHQARAQLQACILASEKGADVIPVWNKSNREHITIGSEPGTTRSAGDAAVKALGWKKPYHVDADHIRVETVDRFIPHSDFYTIDVADWIGKPADAAAVEKFLAQHSELVGEITIPGINKPFRTTKEQVHAIAAKYMLAVKEAGRIYRHIVAAKGEGKFITEVSMDETDSPQTPPELLIILAALSDERIPIQTIAPKFTGRFNKGVDYVGDLVQFEKEFREDLAVIAMAVKKYGLPTNLKLSVHSGSDKFSIYPAIRRGIREFGAGLHIKTAGTTWLEEIIGLAEAGGEGLVLAKDIYADSIDHLAELCAPYASVIDIDVKKLPTKEAVKAWTSEQYVSALRHDQKNPAFNPNLRQLLHVGYKMAAKQGSRYLNALVHNESVVARNVTGNLYERHLKPLFVG
jgi:hypothetical protein